MATASDQLARQWRLLRLLSASAEATVRALAAETGRSERTIRRDLLVLRQVGFPLVERKAGHGLKHFKVDRITSVKTELLKFTRPPDFDAAAFLSGSFGIFASQGEVQTIRIRFAAPVARILKEKTFHPSQRLQVEPSGTLLATYELSSLEEFVSWILSFGPHAEVLEPATLRAQVIEKLEASLVKYREEKTKAQGRAVRKAR